MASSCQPRSCDGSPGSVRTRRSTGCAAISSSPGPQPHAAWRGAEEVDGDDIAVAVELALPHRRRRDPFDNGSLDDEALSDAMAAGDGAAGEPDPGLTPTAVPVLGPRPTVTLPTTVVSMVAHPTALVLRRLTI